MQGLLEAAYKKTNKIYINKIPFKQTGYIFLGIFSRHFFENKFQKKFRKNERKTKKNPVELLIQPSEGLCITRDRRLIEAVVL